MPCWSQYFLMINILKVFQIQKLQTVNRVFRFVECVSCSLDCQFAPAALSSWETPENFQCLQHVWGSGNGGMRCLSAFCMYCFIIFSSEWPVWLEWENPRHSRNKLVEYFIYINSKELLEGVITFKHMFSSLLLISQSKLKIFFTNIQILLIYPVHAEWWVCVQLVFSPFPPPPEGEGRIMLSVFKMEFGQSKRVIMQAV